MDQEAMCPAVFICAWIFFPDLRTSFYAQASFKNNNTAKIMTSTLWEHLISHYVSRKLAMVTWEPDMNLNEFGPKTGKNQKDNCVVLGDIVSTGSLKSFAHVRCSGKEQEDSGIKMWRPEFPFVTESRMMWPKRVILWSWQDSYLPRCPSVDPLLLF